MMIFNGIDAAMDAAKKRVKREERRVTIFKGPNDDHIIVATSAIAVAHFPGGREQWSEVKVVPTGWPS